MGYLTEYTLTGTIEGQEVAIDGPKEMLTERSGYYALGSSFETKYWENQHEDMYELSIAYPDIMFCLEGKGEEEHNWWRAYYKNGKYQHCSPIITWEQPNNMEDIDTSEF